MRIGRVVRALRRRRGWRQMDLAGRAVSSQQAISLIETGHGDRTSFRTLARVLGALDAELDGSVRWRGGEVERLLDAGHATLEGAIARRLGSLAWLVRAEVTYAVERERGSIDILAFEPRTGALLVVEVKTELLSAEATARKLDEKVRLAADIARDRFAWVATTVSALLVLPDSRTARRRIQAFDDLFGRLYPFRSVAVRRWLRAPRGSMSGVMFLAATKTVGGSRVTHSRRRIRIGRAA